MMPAAPFFCPRKHPRRDGRRPIRERSDCSCFRARGRWRGTLPAIPVVPRAGPTPAREGKSSWLAEARSARAGQARDDARRSLVLPRRGTCRSGYGDPLAGIARRAEIRHERWRGRASSPAGLRKRRDAGHPAGSPRVGRGVPCRHGVGAPGPSPARPFGDQTKCWPPLMVSVEPLTKPASSLARYSTACAISSASPRRPVGIVEMILLRISSATAITISVAM